ncbi:hypothetical protein Goarm_006023 [Gossypium armourianum]|uniref:Uncharacterized protein n=1 Tax=Gossypium armourianum TaxID=34283 RepID=A0A7J9JGQ6_9ROSI|nr:hypothetical protein [Gossypium armourianum]
MVQKGGPLLLLKPLWEMLFEQW